MGGHKTIERRPDEGLGPPDDLMVPGSNNEMSVYWQKGDIKHEIEVCEHFGFTTV